MTDTNLNRRDFLKILGTSGAGLIIGIYLGGCDTPVEVPPTGIPDELPDPTKTVVSEEIPYAVIEPNIYLKIESTGAITITAFRSEMGQGVRTAIAMILAEDLDANWADVIIEQAPADRQYGDQVTGGSASISGSYFTLRMAGGAVRQMLVTAAAQEWDVNPEDCSTHASRVIHPDGETQLTYGELVEAALEQDLPQMGSFTLKSEEEFRIIGTGIHHWDAENIITGKAIYGMDVKIPGMLYATIARCPVFGGQVARFDDSQTRQVAGVKSVNEINGAIAVVAENTWAAIKGRAALEITWDEGNNGDLNSETIRSELAGRVPKPGSADSGEIDAVYEFPYQAHVPMEPMNCTVDVREDFCEVWAPTQDAQNVQRSVQSALRFSSDQVKVNVTLSGGGFGRRLQADYAVEAALVSQAVGAPVKVIWTREDDIQHDYYHPMSYLYVKGNPENIRRPSVRSQDGGRYIPTGAWRSVGNHPDAYARECFIDELAHAAGRDPLDDRREIFSGPGLRVIELAAEKSGWGDPLPEGWGRGIGYHATFGVTDVAMVAEVEVVDGKVRVHRMVCAVDCGIAVNPDNIAAQMEGGVAFGLTALLKAGITIEDGRVQESNYHDCPILQIDEMPQVEVYIVKSDGNPSGIGEMGVPPVAPTVVNAIFDATGIRVRHMPIRPEDLA